MGDEHHSLMFLTVSGQLYVEAYCLALTKFDTFALTDSQL